MNDMKLVRELLKEPPAPSGRVTAKALNLLEAEIAGGGRSPARTRRAARRWSLGFGGLAAAGVAAAITLALAGGGPATHSPQASEPTVAAYPGSPPPRAAKLSGDVRHMLLAAATIAEREPSATGKYWHVAYHSTELQTVGERHHPYVMRGQSRYEEWFDSDARQNGWELDQALGATPATAGDRAAWQRAGSPSSIPEVTSDPPEYNPRLSTSHGKPIVDVIKPGADAAGRGHAIPMTVARSLPVDPDKVKAVCDRYKETGQGPVNGYADGFECGVNLLIRYPLAPKARAGVYRMLAALPRINKENGVRDQTGRPGVGLWSDLTMVDDTGTTVRDRLILDPATGRPLALDTVVLRHGTGAARLYKKGIVQSSLIIQGMGWTNTPPKAH
jgi:hypothetical protein